MTLNEVHTSSLIVHVKPQYLATISQQILAIPNTEIPATSEEGKIIVVLETENQGYVTDAIDKINNLDHVLITFLVYHHIEYYDTHAEGKL
ncbi:chaperone NapD [Photobacterium carnosum]|jgi:nitrate reductase NapD|uniref:Chaperone NapD n=1 Tax=Photobacterium carnosum TaxID=2023717 RepID=A0A2N4UXY0_9GAMM|nr:chaperone NapD [Photobacterium carnosum]KAE8176585.1 nitrate reductase [Photobacterium carnosum]MBY3787314.1 chaperone NapD [Photobacterium carnosum]MCD9493591.1 nitrate reductase [Photobacterium carnosum]MCD9499094.1 nitrate reductase [Photobacterium carnosum]MCD9513612.1 nitrate reductase [Photobacterium carnosum]